jgi:hypothetical protein
MALTLLASWLVGSKSPRRRLAGFCTYLVSNAAWVAWALPEQAYALVFLQAFLVVTNVRGVLKSRQDA